jgi:hypothetical protein
MKIWEKEAYMTSILNDALKKRPLGLEIGLRGEYS